MTNNEIKKMIKEKGGSLKKAANEMEIPYTTLFDALKRDIKNTKLEHASIIANYLNLSIDSLMKNKKESINDIEKNKLIKKLNNFSNQDLNELNIIIDKIIIIKENC